MDYHIVGTMVRKNREALDKERGGLFDDDQFATLLGCKHFKQNEKNSYQSHLPGFRFLV